MTNKNRKEQFIQIPVDSVSLSGDLTLLEGSLGIVLFAHGSGSGRHSRRNRYVAIGLLTNRLVAVTDWLVQNRASSNNLNIAYFGASTGAAAALAAAAKREDIIKAVVSRGGRPDLADPYLGQVEAPTLLIVGGYDTPVIQMNQEAFDKLQQLSAEKGEKKLVIVPEATHLFEEPGKLEIVAQLASGWFARFLP